MQLLPTDSDSRVLPVGLLLISLILIYMFGFHWFVSRQMELGDTIDSLESRYIGMKAVTQQREALAEQLRKLQNQGQDADLFLAENDANSASAGMTDILKQLIIAETEDQASCSVVSSQPVRAKLEERFQRASVNIRMNCSISDFVNVLYKLEDSRPMMLVEELNVYKITARRTRGASEAAKTDRLDIRFNLTGYMRNRGEGG